MPDLDPPAPEPDSSAVELLLAIVGHHWAEIHHVENQRAGLASIVLLIASGCTGLYFTEGFTSQSAVAGILMLVGGFGLVATEKLYERYSFTQARLEAWYVHLDELCPGAQFLKRRRDSDTAHKGKFRPRIFTKIRVSYLWLALHLMVILVGAALAFVAYFAADMPVVGVGR